MHYIMTLHQVSYHTINLCLSLSACSKWQTAQLHTCINELIREVINKEWLEVIKAYSPSTACNNGIYLLYHMIEYKLAIFSALHLRTLPWIIVLKSQADSLLFVAVLLLLQPIQIEEVDPVFQMGGLNT